MAEDVAGQGNIPWNERLNVEETSEAEVMMLRDNFLKFAKDNFSTATVTILTKNYANEFKEFSSPLPSIDFQLQFIQATFVSWSRSDPRVSKEKFYQVRQAIAFRFNPLNLKRTKAQEF